MASSAILPFSEIDQAKKETPSASPPSQLDDAAVGASVIVVELTLEDDLRAWLDAVGISVGEELTVLRRAAFGGPLHVRTRSGGEFALNLALARAVLVARPHKPGDSAA